MASALFADFCFTLPVEAFHCAVQHLNHAVYHRYDSPMQAVLIINATVFFLSQAERIIKYF